MFDQRNQKVENQYNAGRDITINVAPPSDAREKRNRQRMLQKVRDFWIKGVLEKSLHDVALIELGMEYKPDAVQHPWEMVLKQPDQPARSIPSGTKIIEVFDELGGELLILGEPGSGKTTMMLELARDLVIRAEQDESHPIPVVFNLSSWATKRQSLKEWLIEELNTKYDVPRKLGVAWVDADHVLPLLDGLDEVKEEQREACIEMLNVFRLDHGLVNIAVCSRYDDYYRLSAQLKLQSAMAIKPLTPQQIVNYLEHAGTQLEAILTLIQRDRILQEMIGSPLMLSILTLTYRGITTDKLPTLTSSERWREYLFDTYVQQMFQRRGFEEHYAKSQTVNWLMWLGRQMLEHDQTVFYLERMQPHWILPSSGRRLYIIILTLAVALIVISGVSLTVGASVGLSRGIGTTLIVGLSAGVCFGLPIILPLGLASEIWLAKRGDWTWRKGLTIGLGWGLFGGLIYGAFCGLVSGLFLGPIVGLIFGTTMGLSYGLMWSIAGVCGKIVLGSSGRLTFRLAFGLVMGLASMLAGLVIALMIGLFSGVIIGLIRGIIQGLATGVFISLASILFMLFNVIISGPSHVLMSWLIAGLAGEIKSVETLRWSWRRALAIGATWGLICSLILGITITLIMIVTVDLVTGLFWGFTTTLGTLLITGISVGLIAGFAGHEVESRTRPNQGIWRSAKYALFGLIGGSTVGLIEGLVEVLAVKLVISSPAWLEVVLRINLFIVPLAGIIVALVMGLGTCIQHFALRLVLWRSRAIPWNYARFLDYCVDRIFLRKVGGGYIFIHRMLMEYFASLDETADQATEIESAEVERRREGSED
jgi:DNA polymerase III delta prime subunit